MSERLLQLAAEKFGTLTEAERRFYCGIASGKFPDFSSTSPRTTNRNNEAMLAPPLFLTFVLLFKNPRFFRTNRRHDILDDAP